MPNKVQQLNIVIIGGGAAGLFAAINCAEMHTHCKVILIEKGRRLLEKVKISGGGRCNVTNACFEVSELIKNYPRGSRELIAPFQQFQPKDTINWFEKRGVKLKTENDNRMFPITDDSQTIIDCLLDMANKVGVDIYTQVQINNIQPPSDNTKQWILTTNLTNDNKIQTLYANALLFATGSSQSTWNTLHQLGHSISPPIPSLFTFNIKDQRLTNLLGIAVPNTTLQIANTNIKTEGALLITHWGLSGPAVLRLSAFGAKILHEKQYNTNIIVNFVAPHTQQSTIATLQTYKQQHPKKTVIANALFNLPLRLWQSLINYANIPNTHNWADVSNKNIQQIADVLQQSTFIMKGKSTFKEEFVTCGGIALKEINFKTMQSRLLPNLFFAGEVIDIDAITGGFNFQAAWTTAYIAAQNMGKIKP